MLSPGRGLQLSPTTCCLQTLAGRSRGITGRAISHGPVDFGVRVYFLFNMLSTPLRSFPKINILDNRALLVRLGIAWGYYSAVCMHSPDTLRADIDLVSLFTGMPR